jgi:hypothetical protein
MKKLLILLAFLPIAFLSSVGQGARYENLATTVTPPVTPGGFPTLLAIPGATVVLCNNNSSPCNSKTQTYTDATMGTPCSTSAQMTMPGSSVCTATTDVAGNIGFWFNPPAGGVLYYTETVGNTSYGPYSFLVGASTASANSWSGTQTFADFVSLSPVIDARYYGLVGDGLTDNTANWNTMVAAACTLAARAINFPAGQFRFASKPNTIGCGPVIHGQGDGSTCQYGTCFVADYVEGTATNGFITFDGSYSPGFAGTGGGLENIFIEKANTKTGGVALKLTGADNNHRAGHFHADHVQIGSTGTGTWNYGFYVDGSLLVTPGGQGVRDVDFNGVYINGATTHTVYLDNVAKFHYANGEVYQGAGSLADIVVTGQGGAGVSPRNSTEVSFANVTLSGSMTIDQATTTTFFGHIVTNLTVTANAAYGGVFGLVSGTVTNNSTAFSYSLSSTDTAGMMAPRFCTNGAAYTCGGNAGDSTDARSATTGFHWFGWDYLAYFGRLTDTTMGIGGGHAQTFQIASTVGALELNTDLWLARTGSGAVACGSTNAGTDCALALASISASGAVAAGSLKAGAAGSTISDSRELIQSAHSCGTTSTCANTANGSYREIFGSVALSSGTPSTVTVSGISPAFTSTSTYFCTFTPEGGTAAIAAGGVAYTKVSSSSFTITGPNTVTTVIDYRCVGN